MTNIANVTKKRDYRVGVPVGDCIYDGIAPGLEYRTIQECLTCDLPSCDGCPRDRLANGKSILRVEPCSLCGGTGKVIEYDGKYVIECWGCGAETGMYAYKKLAIKAWNNGKVEKK